MVSDLVARVFFVNFYHSLADGLHIALFIKYMVEEARGLAGGSG